MQVDEIVARALCRSKQQWGDTAAVTEQYVETFWRDYLPDAKVAILALESARSAEPQMWGVRVPTSRQEATAMQIVAERWFAENGGTGGGSAEPVAWQCWDLVADQVSVITDKEHALALARSRAWRVFPLFAGPYSLARS